jgi:Fe-S cluster assembly ATP-binding protein
MLQTKSLNVEVEHKSILSDLSVNFDLGKNYCILGKNGSGKSSLAMTLMGHPGYIVTHGDIILDNQSLLTTSPDQRAKAGIFLAMQHIPEIKGVKLFEFLRSIYDAKNGSNTSFLQFKKIIEPLMTEIQLEKDFLRRDLNV